MVLDAENLPPMAELNYHLKDASTHLGLTDLF